MLQIYSPSTFLKSPESSVFTNSLSPTNIFSPSQLSEKQTFEEIRNNNNNNNNQHQQHQQHNYSNNPNVSFLLPSPSPTKSLNSIQTNQNFDHFSGLLSPEQTKKMDDCFNSMVKETNSDGILFSPLITPIDNNENGFQKFLGQSTSTTTPNFTTPTLPTITTLPTTTTTTITNEKINQEINNLTNLIKRENLPQISTQNLRNGSKRRRMNPSASTPSSKKTKKNKKSKINNINLKITPPKSQKELLQPVTLFLSSSSSSPSSNNNKNISTSTSSSSNNNNNNVNNRLWKTCFVHKDYVGTVDVSINSKTRCDKPSSSVPEKMYSSLKYEISQVAKGTLLKTIPFLHGKIRVVSSDNFEEIRKADNKQLLKGTVEGSLTKKEDCTTSTGTGTLKVQFTDVSYHHKKKSFCWEILYCLPSKCDEIILIKRSAPFLVFARKQNNNKTNSKKNKKSSKKRKRTEIEQFSDKLEALVENGKQLDPQSRKSACDLILQKLKELNPNYFLDAVKNISQ